MVDRWRRRRERRVRREERVRREAPARKMVSWLRERVDGEAGVEGWDMVRRDGRWRSAMSRHYVTKVDIVAASEDWKTRWCKISPTRWDC